MMGTRWSSRWASQGPVTSGGLDNRCQVEAHMSASGDDQRITWRSRGIFSHWLGLEIQRSLSSQASWNKNEFFPLISTFIMWIILTAWLKCFHFIYLLSSLFPNLDEHRTQDTGHRGLPGHFTLMCKDRAIGCKWLYCFFKILFISF